MNRIILISSTLIILLSVDSCTSSTYKSQKVKIDTTVKVAPTSIVRNIKQDRKGTIWVASWDGIFKYNGKQVNNFTKEISDARFFSVLEDKKGNYWFSTVGSGVYFYNGSNFQNFTTNDGLANNVVMEIFEAKDESIWFSTEGGLSKYDGHRFQNFTSKEGLPSNEVYSIMEDHQGNFWIGTKEGIGLYDGNKITEIKHEGKSFKNVRLIIKDKHTNIWFGGNDGLWLYKDNKFKNYSTSFTGYIYEDHAGNLLTSSTNQHTEKSLA